MIHQQPNPGIHYEYIIPGENVISPQLLAHRRPGKMPLFPMINLILLPDKLMEKFMPLNAGLARISHFLLKEKSVSIW